MTLEGMRIDFVVSFVALFAAVLSDSLELGFDFSLLDQIISADIELSESMFEDLLVRTDASKCIQEAVRELVHQCVESGVDSLDPLVRKVSAVKLSICEFENTGIIYPSSCRSLGDPQGCIVDLEKSPQLWTSFSGNYRETFQICYAESLPFAKDQIINVFYNITKIYSKLQREFADTSKVSDRVISSIKQELHDLYVLTEKLMSQQQSHHANMQADFEDFHDAVQKDTSSTIELLNGFFEATRDKSESSLYAIDKIQEQIGFLGHLFDDQGFARKIMALKADYLFELEEVESESAAVFAKIMSSLHDSSLITEESVRFSEQLRNSLHASALMTSKMQDAINQSTDAISNQRQRLQEEFQYSYHELSELTDEISVSLTDQLQSKFLVFEGGFETLSSRLNGSFDQLDLLNEKIQNVTSQLGSITFPRLSLNSLLLSPMTLIQQALRSLFKSQIMVAAVQLLSILVIVIVLASLLSIRATSFILRKPMKRLKDTVRNAFTALMKLTISIAMGVLLAMFLTSCVRFGLDSVE